MRRLLQGLTVAALLAMPLFATPASAHNDGETNRAEAKERVQGKLDETRKKVCLNRVNGITRIMTQAASMGQRHLEVFSKITERVQAFYTKNSLAVDNYDALVAAAASKKSAAEAAIKAVKDSPALKCDGENPAGEVDAFKAKVQAMHAALKEYRTAVKDLLVAVKKAAEAKEGEAQ